MENNRLVVRKKGGKSYDTFIKQVKTKNSSLQESDWMKITTIITKAAMTTSNQCIYMNVIRNDRYLNIVNTNCNLKFGVI